METHLVAVTVIGTDRPGIVAAVTKALYELGGNLEDATSTILRGHFAMMLIVQVPPGLDASAVEDRLAPTAADLDLVVTARPLVSLESHLAAPTHVVSVYGADKPGIVYRVADFLAAHGANISDLTSRVVGPDASPVYSVMLELVAPPELELESDLRKLASELGVEVAVNRVEPDVL